MTNKERFLDLCSQVKREGIEDLLAWLETTDFFEAPASTRYHGSYAGGLLEHSLNVYDELKRLLKAYPEVQCSEETAIILSLFHDLCKSGCYTIEKRNKKTDEGKWIVVDTYVFNEQFSYGGHGSKSVYLLMKYIKLTDEEAVAINCHMGAYGENPQNVGQSYEQFPLAWLLHVADEAASFIQEKRE